MQNENAPFKKPLTPKKGKGETISELAHRHLRDEKHTTTDEELRNATVELSNAENLEDTSLFEVDNSTVIPSTGDDAGINEDVKSNDGDDDKIPNPYTVLSK